jgi:hypothetical protein
MFSTFFAQKKNDFFFFALLLYGYSGAGEIVLIVLNTDLVGRGQHLPPVLMTV